MPKKGVISERYRAAVGTYSVEATKAERVEARVIITDVSGAKVVELNQVGLRHLREILQEVEEFFSPADEETKSVGSRVSSASDNDGVRPAQSIIRKVRDNPQA